jgi:putative permease
VAIIAAVFIFGGIWGLWGVFFAIPLATLVHAVLKSWPRHDLPEELAAEDPGGPRITGREQTETASGPGKA